MQIFFSSTNLFFLLMAAVTIMRTRVTITEQAKPNISIHLIMDNDSNNSDRVTIIKIIIIIKPITSIHLKIVSIL